MHSLASHVPVGHDLRGREGAPGRTLILVAPFTDFSKELAMGQEVVMAEEWLFLDGCCRRLAGRGSTLWPRCYPGIARRVQCEEYDTNNVSGGKRRKGGWESKVRLK
jgi:hypothetical protein